MEWRREIICILCGYKLGIVITPSLTESISLRILDYITTVFLTYAIFWPIWTLFRRERNVDRYETRSAIRYIINACSSRNTSSTTQTYWHNFGLWRRQEAGDYSDYVSACESLVQHVCHCARITDGDRILDVGVGCGDQDILISQSFPFCDIVALEYSDDQVATARARVESHRRSAEIHVRQGDAATDVGKMAEGSFDKVLCIDAAYHFHTRAHFLNSAFSVLKPEGNIALMDFTFDCAGLPSPISSLLRYLLSMLLSLPIDNLYNMSWYRAELLNIGYKDISSTDISLQVFPGFHQYISNIHENKRHIFNSSAINKLRLISSTLLFLHRYGILHCHVITARKMVR